VHPAVIAVWAAVLAAAHLLPTIPIVGSGSTFSVSSALVPLAGILFGPVGGALCAAAGNFLGSLIAPHTAWLGLGTFIVGTTTAFTAGLAAWGYWPLGLGVIALGTAAWFTQEIGRSVPLYPAVFYGLGALAVILSGLCTRLLFRSPQNVRSVNALRFPAVWLAAFGGLVAGASIGNFFGLLLLRWPARIWPPLILVSPVERAIFALGSALIGVPLLIGLPKMGIIAGPQSKDADGEEEPD
jgi:hypothetical protein